MPGSNATLVKHLIGAKSVVPSQSCQVSRDILDDHF
jgi:hypothetical protein